jgi:hypothetical protein
MNGSIFLTAGALAMAATCAVAAAQPLPEGRIYAFHSSAQGGCPALDWHVVVGANNTLDGMISWDAMKSMAHASGSVNAQARTFSMRAKEVGGQGRTATVDGTLRGDGYLLANIKGPNVTCTNVAVPWYVTPVAGG